MLRHMFGYLLLPTVILSSNGQTTLENTLTREEMLRSWEETNHENADFHLLHNNKFHNNSYTDMAYQIMKVASLHGLADTLKNTSTGIQSQIGRLQNSASVNRLLDPIFGLQAKNFSIGVNGAKIDSVSYRFNNIVFEFTINPKEDSRDPKHDFYIYWQGEIPHRWKDFFKPTK